MTLGNCRRFSLALVLLSVFPPVLLADQVVLKNGDRLTVTIKKLDKGVLQVEYFKKGVELPWEEVTSLESADDLYFSLKDGQVVVGKVRPNATGWEVTTSDTGTVPIAKDSVQTIRSGAEEKVYQAEIERLRNPGLLDLWSGFLDTGLATTQGNSQSTTFNLGLSADRTSPRDKVGVYITTLYARSDTTGISLTTANTIRGGFRYDVDVRPKLFAFGFTDLEYDQFQGLDLRFVPGGGFGYHWLKTDQTRFDIFGGGSLNKEFFVGNLDRTSGEIVLGEQLFHQLIAAAHLEHKLVVFPNVTDTGEYRITTDNALVMKLSRWLSWQLSLSDRLNSNPIPGKKKNDLLFTTGLRFTFE